jgi:hypothetical protein
MALRLNPKLMLAVVLVGSIAPAWPQVDAPLPSSSLETCRQALSSAGAAIAKMPEGVEKASALKELSAGKSDMANGNPVSCNAHAKNALLAAGTKPGSGS